LGLLQAEAVKKAQEEAREADRAAKAENEEVTA